MCKRSLYALLLCLLGSWAFFASCTWAAQNTEKQNPTLQQNAPEVIQLTLSFAKDIKKEDAIPMVTSIAYMRALRSKHTTLTSQRLLSLGTQDTLEQMALVAHIFTPVFNSITYANAAGGDISAKVVLKQEQSPLAHALKNLFAQQDLINMRKEWLQFLQKHTAMGEDILLMASGIKKDTLSTPLTTLHGASQKVGPTLQALWLFHTALLAFDHTWQHPQNAEALLQQACSLSPDLALLWTSLGEVQLQLDTPHRAIESLNKALALESTRGKALYMRGLAYLRLHQPSLAKVDFSSALTLQPEQATWLRARGASSMLLKEYAPMCDDFAKACALGDCEGLQNARTQNFCLPQTPHQ